MGVAQDGLGDVRLIGAGNAVNRIEYNEAPRKDIAATTMVSRVYARDRVGVGDTAIDLLLLGCTKINPLFSRSRVVSANTVPLPIYRVKQYE